MATVDASLSSGSGSTLRGTPVVPGVVAGPVLRVVTEVSPEAVARFSDGGFADQEAALAAYDASVVAVADSFSRKAAAAHGAAAEVLTASAGLAKDKGLRGAVAKSLGRGTPLVAAVGAAVEGFVTAFTSMGGLMAERVTDLQDIERRVVAHLVGEPEPGVPTPDRALGPRRRGPGTRGHRGAGSRAGGRDRDRAGRADQPHRDHRAPARHPLRRRLRRRSPRSRPGRVVVVDGESGVVEPGPTPARPPGGWRRAGPPGRCCPRGGARPTADGTPVKLLANVADASSAQGAGGEPVQGVGLFRTELCFLDRQVEPDVEEQADIYAEVLAPFAEGPHVVVRTLDAGSDKPIAFATHDGEENPALGVRGLRLSFDNPGLMDRQLDGIAAAAERPAPRPG